MKSTRRKVFISAYACEPGKGSEPGVGWNWVKQIAQFHKVWVVTRANNRQAIERALKESPLPTVQWVYFDLPWWLRVWKKGQRGVHLYYFLWQVGAYLKGRKLHEATGFDLAHHLTFGNYWLPSFFPFLSIPFVWGPLGGGESAPRVFYQTFSFHSAARERLRSAARWLGEKNPVLSFTARSASVALAKANETAERLWSLGASRVELCSEAGIESAEFDRLSAMPFRDARPFRLISIGRLVDWKGFHLGLMAFRKLQRELPGSEYYLVGDGPERGRLQKLMGELGVASKVRFWGVLPRNEALQKLADCDVLVHPSLHDSGGWVCLEAMAAGRPVICLKLGGPALQVTRETGFPVAPITPQQVIDDLSAAMLRLGRDPNLRRDMGEAARRRIHERYLWEGKARLMRQLYEEALGGNVNLARVKVG